MSPVRRIGSRRSHGCATRRLRRLVAAFAVIPRDSLAMNLPVRCIEEALGILASVGGAARTAAGLYFVFAIGLGLCATADFPELTLHILERWCGSGRRLVKRLAHGSDVFGRSAATATDDARPGIACHRA